MCLFLAVKLRSENIMIRNKGFVFSTVLAFLFGVTSFATAGIVNPGVFNTVKILAASGVGLSAATSSISAAGLTSTAGIAAGGAITGATAVNATGLGTFHGMTAGTGTVKGSSDGTTTTYVPPFYSSGAAIGSTGHMSMGTFTATATTMTPTLSPAMYVSAVCLAVQTTGGAISTVWGGTSGGTYAIFVNLSVGYSYQFICFGS